ncbi:methyltransferase domain-containing protein [Flavobacterium jejuense]|uniref:Methyltransferase domain-containing protein n=1 Tax=Flavobacterium jejuense TaxID=1544455 RepID=A0ABX0IT25_9FLAO|nr:methyltransferase domain-containing protein [Flavobacterium jejuense]NHN25969.1 methyltransferase domain-containing protein [Flavobacterium jejuense]
MIKRLLSYIIPIKIYEKTSKISQTLEVSWNNGKLVLDSKNTNYSYGSLQKVLRKGLIAIGFEKILKMNEVLVLGVAGGSVIKTLVDEIHFKGNITGVEIDENSITIANQYFGLNQIKNYKTVIGDAKEIISKMNKKQDLIIIDIFEDTEMPAFLFEKKFVDSCKQILNINGYILFNTMILNEKQIDRNNSFLKQFEKKAFYCKTYSKVEYYNQLIIIEKLA